MSLGTGLSAEYYTLSDVLHKILRAEKQIQEKLAVAFHQPWTVPQHGTGAKVLLEHARPCLPVVPKVNECEVLLPARSAPVGRQ